MDKNTFKAIAFFSTLGIIIYTFLPIYMSHSETTEIVYPCEQFRNTASTSLKITCMVVGRSRICMEQSPPPAPNSTVVWSEFIGIGPARTGSTALMWMLEEHPQIQVGDYRLQNLTCCRGGELYFFNRDALFMKGLDFYKGFFAPRGPNVKIVGEKTPKYSSHPLVPYRIRALLGPKVKFIFTIRDPLEALLSLYGIRHRNDNVSVSDYFEELLRAHREYEACVRDALAEVQMLTEDRLTRTLYETLEELDWHAAVAFDEAALSCWRDPVMVLEKKATGEIENLQHYIYKENLMRWYTVFSKSQVICVWSDELRTRASETFNEVLRFLGLDTMQSNFKNVDFKADEKRRMRLKTELGPLHREMCEFLMERNRGIEKLCPRLWPGEWKWCTDIPP